MQTITKPQVDQAVARAHQQAYSLEFTTLVGHAVDLLGGQLVAIISGVSDMRRVKDWLTGKREPRDVSSEQGLRVGYQVALILTDSGRSKKVAQAWFQGANPFLNYKAPAMVLREGPPAQAAPGVIQAARAFIGE